jgi:hypothetical protein
VLYRVRNKLIWWSPAKRSRMIGQTSRSSARNPVRHPQAPVWGEPGLHRPASTLAWNPQMHRCRNLSARPPLRSAPLTEQWKKINKTRSRVRARGEHAFHVVKRLWGFARGPVPRPGEEYHPRLRRIRTRQPVHGTATTAPLRGVVCPCARIWR